MCKDIGEHCLMKMEEYLNKYVYVCTRNMKGMARDKMLTKWPMFTKKNVEFIYRRFRKEMKFCNEPKGGWTDVMRLRMI